MRLEAREITRQPFILKKDNLRSVKPANPKSVCLPISVEITAQLLAYNAFVVSRSAHLYELEFDLGSRLTKSFLPTCSPPLWGWLSSGYGDTREGKLW